MLLFQLTFFHIFLKRVDVTSDLKDKTGKKKYIFFLNNQGCFPSKNIWSFHITPVTWSESLFRPLLIFPECLFYPCITGRHLNTIDLRLSVLARINTKFNTFSNNSLNSTHLFIHLNCAFSTALLWCKLWFIKICIYI